MSDVSVDDARADRAPRTFDPGVAPWAIEDSGLSSNQLLDLLLKVFYVQGLDTLEAASAEMCVEIGLLQDVVERAKSQRLLESRGYAGHERRLMYALTDTGRAWAREALVQNKYVGPAPVSFDSFVAQVNRQTIAHERVDRTAVEGAFEGLVVPAGFVERLGPAVNSTRAMLLYGPPGNGKTTMALQVAEIFRDIVAIPYAVDFGGDVVRVFDPIVHDRVEGAFDGAGAGRPDLRWVACRRPRVVVGGELTLDMVELRYVADSGFYQAPLQLKAVGGVFLIDDLGRQRVRAEDLLNRWIVPMEKQVDYFNTVSGKTFAVPFDNLLIFSTNLRPNDLMDAAFLRRIPYKLEVAYPTKAEFGRVFQRVGDATGINVPQDAVDRVVHELMTKRQMPISFYQPKFIVDQVIDACRFEGIDPRFDEDHIQRAVDNLIAEPGDEASHISH